MTSKNFHCSLALAFVLASLSTVSADNWSSWRGPNNLGISAETDIPRKWSPAENAGWKLKMPGAGSCTPAVWGDRIFVTSEDGNDTVLMSVDAVKGTEIWKRPLGAVQPKPGFMATQNNSATPSPSTDGKHVWAVAGAGLLTCFTMDGKQVWQVDAQKKYGKFKSQFGMHTTPVLDGDRLYWFLIQGSNRQSTSESSPVMCLDAETGAEIWKVDRPSDGTNESLNGYASPLIYRKGDLAYLLVHGDDYCTAHDLKDGSEIWRVGGLNPKANYNRNFRFVASPVAAPELIVVPSCKSGPVVGVKPTAKGTFAGGSENEQFRLPRNTPDVSSPLVKDGLVYLCRESGRLVCLDAVTGKEYYDEKIHTTKYYASPVCADNRIYLTAMDGFVTVVKMGKTFELVAENMLWEAQGKGGDQILNGPAVSNGRLYFRTYNALYAVGTYKVAN